MKKGLIPQNINTALRMYITNGGDIARTHAALKRQDMDFGGERTLRNWEELYKWKERMEKADMMLTAQSRSLKDAATLVVTAQLDAYAQSFGSMTEPDPQATHGFVALMRLALDLNASGKDGKSVRSPEEMREVALEILERDYGIKRET
ncbi:MAG: hypothetical protein KAJ19_24110 [Gammaproteobacteria bacterium]|nr:hypothetical protein [Gammaproteobacteria bacterium]